MFRRLRFTSRLAIPVPTKKLWATIAVFFGVDANARGQRPLPTNNDPTNQIRFDTGPEAEAKRAQVIDFIWNGPLPSAVPTVTIDAPFPDFASDINPANVARVDRLDADVSGWDFHATSYLLHPTNTAEANRTVIVHQGHSGDFNLGRVGLTANHLLEKGFSVVVMMMPLQGWNTDDTATVPGYPEQSYISHDEMILYTQPHYGGEGYRLFLEPVVQNINYLVATNPDLGDISMVGLSGGSWTTTMMAAIDDRIRLSVPVAGGAPFYVANDDAYAAFGDTEQFYHLMYDEDIGVDGSGGGTVTYLELYALGGYGLGRRQILVNNQFDDSVNKGTFADTFKYIVAEKVNELNGSWEHFLDTTTYTHEISQTLVSTVLDDALRPEIVDPSANPADLDDNLVVDDKDIDILWSIIRPEIPGDDDPGSDDDEDFNGDGVLNEDDVDYMLRRLMTAATWMQYGDADLDGGLGGMDYQAWRLRAGTGWANGDFDGDGGVGGIDYMLWRTRPEKFPNNVGPRAGGVIDVPEPTSLLLAALAVPALILTARRSQRLRRR